MPISTPSQITVPFATSGLKNSIPATANPVTGNAGYDAGFPATNMTPKEAGGIPPFGQDFNGILFDITTAIQYLEAGMQFPYSSSFATAVGGYPLGAIVTRTDGTGFWRNTVPNNTTNPETFGAGWQPEGAGITTVAMSNANVTLTALQAARQIVIITGTLTASINLIFPTYQRQWLVINRATGAFSVTCKTSAGSGVSIATGTSQSIYGDGTNIGTSSAVQAQQSVGGVFSNLQCGATGANSNVSVSVDEICLKDGSGGYLTARSVSLPSISTAGSGANGIDVGSVAASTWYSVWIISNGTTTSGLLSLSPTSPTMPSGFSFRSRVGWVRTDSTANRYPLSFKQYGGSISYVVSPGTNLASPLLMASGAAGNTTGPVYAAIPVANFVPSTAKSISLTINQITNSATIFVAPNQNSGGLSSAANPPPISTSRPSGVSPVPTSGSLLLQSGNIYWISDGGSGYVFATGWEDNL